MESLSGLGGAVPMSQIMTGEVIWGGVGSGLYGMLLFVILGVFISGLMVGRTPEFLGKKVEAREIKLTVIGTIAVPMMVLVATALAIGTQVGRALDLRQRAAGLLGDPLRLHLAGATTTARRSPATPATSSPTAPTPAPSASPSPTCSAALAMLAGRFIPMLAALAVAGSLAGKRVAPAGLGTLRTDTPTFVVVLISRDPDRGAPDLRPRPAPRTRGPGPHRPALLSHERTQNRRHRPRRHQPRVRPRLSARHDRRRPGRVPGRGRRVAGRARRQGRRLEADRPGLLARTAQGRRDPILAPTSLLPEPAVGDRLQRDATFFNNPGPNQKDLAAQLRRTSRALPRARAALHARPDAPRGSPPTPSHVGLGRRPAHLRGATRASRPTASRGARGLRRAACSTLIDEHTSRPLFGLARRARSVNVLELNLALDRESRR